MKKPAKYILLSFLTITLFTSCSGHSDRDGLPSMEGHSDPVNNGGKLSGDHIHHSLGNTKSDSINVDTKMQSDSL